MKKWNLVHVLALSKAPGPNSWQKKNLIFKTSQDRRSSFRHGSANGIHQIISVDLAIVCRHKLRKINVGYKDNGRTHLSYNQEMFYKYPLSQDYFALQSQMSVHNEDYSRNETCALYWIHTLLSISGEIPNDDQVFWFVFFHLFRSIVICRIYLFGCYFEIISKDVNKTNK